MRAVIQRVSEASVAIEGQVKAAIGPGLLVLLGIEAADNEKDAEWLARKIPQIRIFPDAEGLMNKSVMDREGEILLVSQFTLFGNLRKGTRPSFNRAAVPEKAAPLYAHFIGRLEAALGKPVGQGEFGAMMKIHLINDGPVTLIVDTKDKKL